MDFIEPFAGIGGFRLGLESVDGGKDGRGETDPTAIPETAQRLEPTKGKGVTGKRGRPDEQPHRKPDQRAFASENLRNKRGFINEKKSKTANGDKRRADVYSKGSSKSFHCVWSNEWDKYCVKIYEKNFHEKPDTRDIRAVPSEEIPDHDLLCAGWPCPTFSIAGKGAGFDDPRGALFFEIARILRDKRPRYFLLENVKGLLSHQAGQTFQIILGVLSNLGYRCEWQVLNSKHFGVPQNRERVFIIGYFGGENGQEIFPIGHADRANSKNNETAHCLDSNYGKGWGKHHQRTMIIHDKRQAGELRLQKEPCVTRHYGTGGGNVPLVANAVDCDGYLRRGGHHDKPIYHYRIRRLTPVECERLQGFPDNWTKGVSDTQRYKMLGNAVTVNVVEVIGRQLITRKRDH